MMKLTVYVSGKKSECFVQQVPQSKDIVLWTDGIEYRVTRVRWDFTDNVVQPLITLDPWPEP